MGVTTEIAAPAVNPDLELAERHRYGDPQAFEEVYQRFSSMVYNLTLYFSGDPMEAEDLSQEIFLRIFRHLGRFGGRSSLKTWVYRVTVNHCRSRLRRRRPPVVPLADEGYAHGEQTRDSRRDPEAVTIAGDMGRVIVKALGCLPLNFREAVILRDLEGLSYREVAAALGVRIGTVRSRIARGREQLRQLLVNYHEPSRYS